MFYMLRASVKNGGVEGALRQLKRMMNMSGLLGILRKKKHYMKPSEIRKQKESERVKKVMRAKRLMKMESDER